MAGCKSHRTTTRRASAASTSSSIATPCAVTRTVRLDGASVGTLTLPALGTWDAWGVASINAALGAGRHSVQIAYEAGNATGINLDNLTVALP